MNQHNKYKDSEIEWVGKIPIHWTKNKFKYLFNEKPSTTNPNLSSGSISFGEVVFKDDESILESTKLSYQEVLEGEFLINPLNLNYDLKSLRISRSNINVVVSQGYIVLRLISEENPFYFKYLLREFDIKHLKSLGNGVRQTISFKHISSEELPLPPLSEQKQIVEYLDTKTSLIDSLIEKTQRKIELLKERRTSLINEVVTKGLNPNVKMKDSGIEWIGKIPDHWSVFKMKYGVKHINEKGLTTKDDIKISPENVESMTGVCFNFYSEYDGEGMRFKKGDILLNKLRLYLKKIVFTETDGYSMGEMIVLRCLENLFNHYFYFLIFNQGLIDLLDSQSNGVKLPRVSPEIIMNTMIPFPPLDEQTKIVDFLDSKTKEIDKMISLEMKSIELLKEYRQSLISEVVTGKVKVTTNE
jgi:type I restriction enzyme S subunit